MLHEIPNIRQPDHRHVKRWFTRVDMDLFVWLNSDMNDDINNSIPPGCQLSFNKRRNELLLSRDQRTGFQCYEIDSAETDTHRYKKSPLMIGSGKHRDIASMSHDFLIASKNIATGLTDFISARLMEYRISRAKHDAARRDHRDMN